MADKYAHEAWRTLRSYGFAVRTDPTEKYSTSGENGRADALVARAGRAVYVEAKTGATSFAFKNWRPNQREWFYEYCAKYPFQMELWFWITMGFDRPNSTNPTDAPRRSYLFSSQIMFQTEQLISPYQDSIPYRVGPAYKREMQDRHLDAENLWLPYALMWDGGGKWKIPNTHAFQQFLNGPGSAERHGG